MNVRFQNLNIFAFDFVQLDFLLFSMQIEHYRRISFVDHAFKDFGLICRHILIFACSVARQKIGYFFQLFHQPITA